MGGRQFVIVQGLGFVLLQDRGTCFRGQKRQGKKVVLFVLTTPT